MITKEYSEALVEVLEIINHLDDNDRNKIPENIIKFYENNKSLEYTPNLNFDEDITKQKLMTKTREILAGIYVDYLCNTRDEKKEYIGKLKQAELKYEHQKRLKYNPNMIFNKKTNTNQINSETIQALVPVKKDNIFIRILKKIKSIFSKKDF